MSIKYFLPLVFCTLILASCSRINPDKTPDDTGEVKTTIAASETTTTTAAATYTNTKTTAAKTKSKTTTTQAVATTVVTVTVPAADEKKEEPAAEAPTEPDPNEEDKRILKAINELRSNFRYFSINGENKYSFEHYTRDGELLDFKNIENYMVYEAEILPMDRVLGSIADEHDLLEKARNVLITAKGQEYMEWLEKEPKHDPAIEYVREKPPIMAQYYEEYDTWYVYPTSPSWKRTDGEKGVISGWSEFPSFMCIRNSDGKLLGCLLNF